MLSKTDYRAEGFLNKRASNAGKKNSVLLIIYWTLMNHIIISEIKNCELFVFFLFCRRREHSRRCAAAKIRKAEFDYIESRRASSKATSVLWTL